MKRLFLSCFGLGHLPIAPGTWGSLPPTVIFAILLYAQTPALLISMVMLVLTLIGSAVCVMLAPISIAATGRDDPREVVVDEVAGQSVTFIAASLFLSGQISAYQIFGVSALGFFLFRVFDVIKPWPIRKLEKLPQGWGILADDILAGVYAGIALLICLKLWMVNALA